MVGPPKSPRSISFLHSSNPTCNLPIPFASPLHTSGMDSPRGGPDSISAACRFIIGKQSALAQQLAVDTFPPAGDDVSEEVENSFLLMYLANEGNVGRIKELIEGGVDINFRDIDDRTALHVAACHGQVAVAELLLRNEAKVDPKDRWGSTLWPMHVKSALQIPEYEINPREFDFGNISYSKLERNKSSYQIVWRRAH